MRPALLREFRAMASPCRVRIDGVCENDREAARAADRAEAEVRRIESKYSRYCADSVLSRVNSRAGSGVPMAVDEETDHLLGFAAQLHEASGGLFDITSGVLRRAWDFRASHPPEASAIESVLALIGWQHVVRTAGTVALPVEGMELDLGGIGKEYAADRAATLLHEAGYRHGYVNLGGDIRLLGPMCDGRPWLLGIAHPRIAGEVAAEVLLGDGALATSGDYERYIDHDGRRYCHVLDPRTGWPVHLWQSVSVIAPACLAAGALTTIAMLMGKDASRFLREQRVAHVLVDEAGDVTRWTPEENNESPVP